VRSSDNCSPLCFKVLVLQLLLGGPSPVWWDITNWIFSWIGTAKSAGKLARSRAEANFLLCVSLCNFIERRYHPRDARMNSETFHYKRGTNQVFSQSTHFIDPTQFAEEDVSWHLIASVVMIISYMLIAKIWLHSTQSYYLSCGVSSSSKHIFCWKTKVLLVGRLARLRCPSFWDMRR